MLASMPRNSGFRSVGALQTRVEGKDMARSAVGLFAVCSLHVVVHVKLIVE